MEKGYKPSVDEILFIIAVVAFIAINICFRGLFVNSAEGPFTLENLLSKKSLVFTAIQLSIFFVIYFIWNNTKRNNDKKS